MAMTIQDTPILKGEDTKRFIQKMDDIFKKKSTKRGRRLIDKEKKEMKECYKLLSSIPGEKFY